MSFADRANLANQGVDWEKWEALGELGKVISTGGLVDRVIAEFGDGVSPQGDLLPWDKTSQFLRLRTGEVTLWGGFNGHFKSAATTQIMLWLLPVANVCIASLEMPVCKTLKRMLRQAAGASRPSDEFIQNFHAWADERLWFYDHVGSARLERMKAVCRYAAIELGCSHVVVDSLLKCVRGTQDYDGQKDFIEAMTEIAKETGCHIHVVHHARKGQDETQIPGKMDFRGAGEITDLVDNAVIVWKDKAKLDAEEVGGPVDDTKPDIIMSVEKQRDGEYEGQFYFWLNKESMQITSSNSRQVMPWPDVHRQNMIFSAVEAA